MHHAHEPQAVRLACAVDELDSVRNRSANQRLGQHEAHPRMAARGIEARHADTIRRSRLNSPCRTARMAPRQTIGENMARPTAPPAGPQSAAGGDPPQLTQLRLFPTPLVIATMPDAAALNAELKRIILAREAAGESV